MVKDLLESPQQVWDNKHLGNEKTWKNQKHCSAIGYGKSQVYYVGNPAISDFYGKALFDKWELHHITNDTQEMMQSRKGLGFF